MRLLLCAALAANCFGQSPAAAARVNQLIEHWRWQQYWKGSTELGPLYRVGREFKALLFWPTDERRTEIGFCSLDLALCFYAGGDRMSIRLGEDLQAALKNFSNRAFEEDPQAAIAVPIPDVSDLATEVTRIKLPALDPPESIRDRKRPPQKAIDALVNQLTACGVGCRAHLIIPYFSPNDPDVPVYFECTGCQVPKTIVRAMWGGDDIVQWWTPISSWGHDPGDVSRARRLIEKALMLEVSR